ncbi:MAG: hypothetical protein M3460_16865 [Actinomycetota bacterium]|nr:hypothetical protein [Actinomycetota bacterium]
MTTGLGLAGCAIAGFRDDVISRLLRLSEDEIPTLLFAVGPQPDPV